MLLENASFGAFALLRQYILAVVRNQFFSNNSPWRAGPLYYKPLLLEEIPASFL